ncbi:MAG: pyridoxal-phosphate dependent enzyme [Flavipsychrobacter sp.]
MDIIPDQLPRIQALSKSWAPTVSIDMLRLDEVHQVISGNKWYKLKENIKAALSAGNVGLITFGGAYSNHLIATAAAANAYNIRSIGIVRGLHAAENLTTTLKSCIAYGMELLFVSREEYARKEEELYLSQLSAKYPNYMIVPEGGANHYGRLGVTALAKLVSDEYDHICVSVGTGTTMAGVINGVGEKTKVYGYAPMKGGLYLKESMTSWVDNANWQLFDDWHFGGFGKHNQELVDFMNEFYVINDIPLDMVYTAKMMYGVKKQVENVVFPSGAKVLAIHTGGLQGNSNIATKLVY